MTYQNVRGYDTDHRRPGPIPELTELCRQAAAEGMVLLKNTDAALPLQKGEKIAVFGRMQRHYLKSGTGSGGNVQPPYQTNIFDALDAAKLFDIDRPTEHFYDEWVSNHPFDNGTGWTQPWSQEEPLLTEENVRQTAARAETALLIITRTAGEDRDSTSEPGSWYLTETEYRNLRLLAALFAKTVVLLNVCCVIDTSWSALPGVSAVLYCWQGGQEGGNACADILSGAVSPSGRMPDTIAGDLKSYPSAPNYGSPVRNFYAEDIYVGYRYFETFSPSKVLYPFGYGLSYTDFTMQLASFAPVSEGYEAQISVRNTGAYAGKQIVQGYVTPPQGKVGKPEKQLCAFAKTRTLQPGEEETLSLLIPLRMLAYYDEETSRWMLDMGTYVFTFGAHCRDVAIRTAVAQPETVLQQCTRALAPVLPYRRMKNDNGNLQYEDVAAKRPLPIPTPGAGIAPSGKRDLKLADAKSQMDAFLAQLTDNDLICLSRAEGMSSPKVTPGTACAFGGVTDSLKSLGIPVLCATDGPSGIRMVSDTKTTALPSATALASTWNEALMEEIYTYIGIELASYQVDLLLGPGVNIHRYPLCGRNFEYLSEDPFLAGVLAAGMTRGLDNAGVGGVVKHFLANNQEINRHGADSVLSERAVREIYALPFEIVVKRGKVNAVMTSYNPVNGSWAASNYDLCTRLLRDDFGFKGFVMTDWWAKVDAETGTDGCTTNLAKMAKAQNDIYMVMPDASAHDDNLPEALSEGTLSRAELQRNARNLCNYILKSRTFRKYVENGCKEELSPVSLIAGKPAGIVPDVTENAFKIDAPAAGRAVLALDFTCDAEGLSQIPAKLLINTKNAASFLLGKGTVTEYRLISLVKGENKFGLGVSEAEQSKITLSAVRLWLL